MFTETMSFRPRNGISAECYWRVRKWCLDNGFAMSDVFNSVIIPLAYYLENFCEVDEEKSMATVELNIGKLPILHVFGGKCYPLMSQRNDSRRAPFTSEELQTRIDYWAKLREEKPEFYDNLISSVQ